MNNIFEHFDKRDFSTLGKSNVLSSNAMIASSHPIASSVGIEILKNGGNAVDAAIAMNAVLCVAEPHMTVVGGDCFVMLSVDGSTNIKSLNVSGKSSSKAKASILRKKNISVITPEMPEAITIPGAVAAWNLLHKDHGYMPWQELFGPAIHYAQHGIKIHERVALDWAKNIQKLSLDFDTSKLFLKNDKSFEFMDNFTNNNLSETFRTISKEGYDGFYRGWVAEDMIKKLEGIIDERAASTNTDSYIVSLFNKGVKEIAKKVNEEAGETAISAVTNDGRIIEEAADLVFHLLVLLRSQNKTMKDVTDKLYERSINQ